METTHDRTVRESMRAGIELAGGIILHDNATVIIRGEVPSLAEFDSAIAFVSKMEARCPFWIGDLYNKLAELHPETYSQLLGESGFKLATLQKRGWISRKTSATERRYADKGVELSVFEAVAKKPHADKVALLERAVDEALTVFEVKQIIRAERRESVLSGSADLSGAFRVIYADPPWTYAGTKALTPRFSAGEKYEQMTTEAICAMPVEAHAMSSSVLFLWCPAPLLHSHGFPVLDAWGFEHKNGIVWEKTDGVFGHYVLNCCEHLLIGTRGKDSTPDRKTPDGAMIRNVQRVRGSGEHSAKPEHFREIITKLYNGPYVELFGRYEVKGWTVHGNKIKAAAA